MPARHDAGCFTIWPTIALAQACRRRCVWSWPRSSFFTILTMPARILSGEALPDQRFDIAATLCKLRDLFSRH
jgi:hypothetical protein